MMKVTPKQYTLKDGRTITIRSAKVEDVESYTTSAKIFCEESEFIPYTKGEFNPTAEEQIKKIQHFIEADNNLLIVALDGDQVIGNLDINGSSRAMMRHTAGIGMGILKEWRGVGVGTALFDEAIGWAKECSPIELLWLAAFATNENGIALYKKIGFEETGRVKDFFKISETEYVDDISFSMKIK